MIIKVIESMMRKRSTKIWERRCIRFLFEISGYKPTGGYPGFLMKGVNFLWDLKQIDDFSLNYLNGEWICHIEGLEFVLNSTEELLILSEVFIKGVYNVDFNHPFVFIDIGMNVGITSLFFAKKDGCKKVVAFEPFQPTLAFAKKNLEKNCKIAQKIHVNEIGLGYPARTIKIDYSEEFKGCMGVNGVGSHIVVERKDLREEQIRVMDVFEALNDIVDEKMILKIDCEGSEYEILDRLNDTGLLSRFDIIMIEWHFKGPASLRKILIDNNFKILSMEERNRIAGMLYAFKK